MLFLKIVDRLDMENNNPSNQNKAFQIQLKQEFKWFLTPEFKKLRENFGKEYHDEYIASKQPDQQKTENQQEKDEEE